MMASRILALAIHAAILCSSAIALARDGEALVARVDATGMEGFAYCAAKNRVAVVSEGAVHFWTPLSAKATSFEIGDWEPSGPIAFSPDGGLLAVTTRAALGPSSGPSWTIRLIDARNGSQVAELEGMRQYPCQFSPDGKVLLLGREGKDLELYQLQGDRRPTRLASLQDSGDVTMAVISPDGKTVVGVSANEKMRVWDVATRQAQRTLLPRPSQHGPRPPRVEVEKARGTPRDVIGQIAYSPDGKLVAAARRRNGQGVVTLWTTSTWRIERTLLVFPIGYVWRVVFSANGSLVAAVGYSERPEPAGMVRLPGQRLRDGENYGVTLFDPRTGEQKATVHAPAADGLAFSGDGKVLLTPSGDISVWGMQELLKQRRVAWRRPEKRGGVFPAGQRKTTIPAVRSREEAIAAIKALHVEFSKVGRDGLRLAFENTRARDAHLAYLAFIPEVEEVDLSWSSMTDAGLEHLGTVKRLRKLNLWSSDVRGPGLKYLAALPQLEELEIETGSPDLLEHLGMLKHLRRLKLEADEPDEAMKHVAPLTQLEELELPSGVTDAGLEHLRDLTHLRALIVDSPVSREGLEHLRGATGLRRLRVLLMAEEDMESLKPSRDLRVLVIGGSRITGAGLAHIEGLHQLERLAIGDTDIADDDLRYLDGMKGLKELLLGGGKTGDRGLEHLRGMTLLRELNLRGTRVGDDGLTHLKGLTGLESLGLRKTQVTGEGLRHLADMKRLRELNLAGTRVDDHGTEKLAALTSLETLDLYDTHVTDAAMKHLRNLKRLRVLYLPPKGVSSAARRELKEALPGLKLDLRGDDSPPASKPNEGDEPDGAKGGK